MWDDVAVNRRVLSLDEREEAERSPQQVVRLSSFIYIFVFLSMLPWIFLLPLSIAGEEGVVLCGLLQDFVRLCVSERLSLLLAPLFCKTTTQRHAYVPPPPFIPYDRVVFGSWILETASKITSERRQRERVGIGL